MNNAPPSLAEIIHLTRQELSTIPALQQPGPGPAAPAAVAQGTSDCIRECGRAALALLQSRPADAVQFAYQKLHDVPYKEVKRCWRRLYVDACLWSIVADLEGKDEGDLRREDELVDELVRRLDMALILTGAPEREELVELWFGALEGVLFPEDTTGLELEMGDEKEEEGDVRPNKRRKISPDHSGIESMLEEFPMKIEKMPTVRCPIPRCRDLSLSSFQTKLSDTATHTPLVIEGALTHWPALSSRPWNEPSYLLSRTLGGRRLVPIEIGKTYTDSAWTQKITSFKDFMETYMLSAAPSSAAGTVDGATEAQKTGYLAQHDLFAQIPRLRADISIPDYCFADPAPSLESEIPPTAKLDDPLLNAWFGPTGTVSPLHTDPYHNILAQVVGYKYVRLYPPCETGRMYPRGVDENGVDMGNTSAVDLDEAMGVWDGISCWDGEGLGGGKGNVGDDGNMSTDGEELKRRYEMFEHAAYVDCVLGPGECLYIPVGWWHYVRSLTASFSVSFWFN